MQRLIAWPWVGADMRDVVSPQGDAAVAARLSTAPGYNAPLRNTPCVATLLEGGSAIDTLPQTARSSVNCRILPGVSVDEVRSTLLQLLASDHIAVTPMGTPVLSPQYR